MHGGGPGFESPRLHFCATAQQWQHPRFGGVWKREMKRRGVTGAPASRAAWGGPWRHPNETERGWNGGGNRRAGPGWSWGGSGVQSPGAGVDGGNESTKMSAWWMPRRLLPRKDAVTLRKALGTCWQRMIQGYPNGATHHRER